MRREYLLTTGSDLGRSQVEYLQTLLDRHTTACLEAVGVKPGQRCLDVGTGGGSITRWLADRTGPSGTVVAVELEPVYLDSQPGVEIRHHDINDGVPPGEPFDVIHVRLVLMHLKRRVEILGALVDALAPGGWLVVGEYSGPPQHVLSAPTAADTELFYRVQDIGHNVVARGGGVSYEWAHEVDEHMGDAGLVNVDVLAVSHTTRGGATGCLLSRNYILQLETPLLAAGLTKEDLQRYNELMLNPDFRAWFYQFLCTRGQKPTEPLG